MEHRCFSTLELAFYVHVCCLSQALVKTEEDRGREVWASQLQQSLLGWQAAIGPNWRQQQQLALAMPYFPLLFGGDTVQENWTSYAFNQLITGW
jgi:hypothetical protein